MNEYNLLIGLIAFIIGFAIAFWVKGLIVSQKVKAAEKETSRILKNAKLRSETLIKEAKLDVKDRLFKMKSEFDAETKDTRSELNNRERRLMQKRKISIARRNNSNVENERFFEKKKRSFNKKKRLDGKKNSIKNSLRNKSGSSKKFQV